MDQTPDYLYNYWLGYQAAIKFLIEKRSICFSQEAIQNLVSLEEIPQNDELMREAIKYKNLEAAHFWKGRIDGLKFMSSVSIPSLPSEV